VGDNDSNWNMDNHNNICIYEDEMNYWKFWEWYDRQDESRRFILLIGGYIFLMGVFGFLGGMFVFALFGLYRITYHIYKEDKKWKQNH